MKNHISINGKLLQTNKKFSQLKASQRTRISEWLYEAYASFAKADGTLLKRDKESVYKLVKQRIDDADIWIPFAEVIKYFEKKRSSYRKRFLEKQSKTSSLH